MYIKLRTITIGAVVAVLSSCMSPYPPNYEHCRNVNADSDLTRIRNNVELNQTVSYSLNDVIDISLRHNLDVRLQRLEETVQCKETWAEALRMLPAIEANGDLSYRNENTAYTSEVIGNTTPILISRTNAPTISSEQTTRRFDIAAIFNILDFGLTYYKTRQEANKGLMLRQRHLRARQNLILDIYKAYYRTIVAKRAVDKSQKLISLLSAREETIEKQISQQVIPELEGLLNKDRLVEMKIRLLAYENEHRSAMTELLGLMGAGSHCHIELEDPGLASIDVQKEYICDLENQALRYRPELMSQDIQICIDADEVRRSMLRMFPDIAPYYGYYHDGNKFLVFNNWLGVGIRASYDLLSLPSKCKELSKNKYQKMLNRHVRLSMSMGVITQVNLAYINVEESVAQYELANELMDVKSRLWKLAESNRLSGQVSDAYVLDTQIEALFAEVNAHKAYGNVQIALEQLANAIGRPQYFYGDKLYTYEGLLEQRKCLPYTPCENYGPCCSPFDEEEPTWTVKQAIETAEAEVQQEDHWNDLPDSISLIEED
ncbi:MAG: TolC family protein [Chlamydiota bacterium]